MITENDVLEAVANFLEAAGYLVTSMTNTTQQGTDIVAVNHLTSKIVLVEAKGGTSSKPTSKRYGRSFTSSQATSHIAVALYAGARLFEKFADPKYRIILAFPDDEAHRNRVDNIKSFLQKVDISVYLVGDDKNVRVYVGAHPGAVSHQHSPMA